LHILPRIPVSFQNPTAVATQIRLALASFSVIHCNYERFDRPQTTWV